MLFPLDLGQLVVQAGNGFLDFFSGSNVVCDGTWLDDLGQFVDHRVDIDSAPGKAILSSFKGINAILSLFLW